MVLSAAAIGAAVGGVAFVILAYLLALLADTLLAAAVLAETVLMQKFIVFELGAVVGAIYALFKLSTWWDRIWSNWLGFDK